MYTFEELREKIEFEIQQRSKRLKEKRPVELYLPVEYSLEMGGKRLRPVLVLTAFNIFSEDISKALPAAIAIEVFHNFTLLHDDIMDKAELRRNRPTVHKKFNENNAILSGDAMAFLSYEFLLENTSERLLDVTRLFSKTAVEVCEGQQYDMDFENRFDVVEDEYLEMIRLKTAVLLGCSLKSGVILAGVDEETSNKFYDYGINLGMAFQLQDDLLDTFGDQDKFGKKIGGDILANKKTYLLIKALELASKEQFEELTRWLKINGCDSDEKISAVKNLYDQIGIKELTKKKIDFYFDKSVQILDGVNIPETRIQPLKILGQMMLKRQR